MHAHQTMKLIMTTYPGFHDLPKGVRKMLLVSESFFFEESRRQTERPTAPNAVLVPPTVLIPKAIAALRQNISSVT